MRRLFNTLYSSMNQEKVVFVFYTINENLSERASWSYGRFPKGWWWVGAGSTSLIGQKPKKYAREQQFMGPKEGQDKMITYLDSFFKKLKEKGIIKIYKLRKSYAP